MAVRNLFSLIVIVGVAGYWGVTSYKDGHVRVPGALGWRENVADEIRRTNTRIGKLTVLEVYTKDVIYLKYEGGFPWRAVGMKCLVEAAASFCPIIYAAASIGADKDIFEYTMDPGNGVIYGHRGILEYVVDLTQAQVEVSANEGGGNRIVRVTVRVPRPKIDQMSVNLNLEEFKTLLRTKQFKDGDTVPVRMERLAKQGFVNALSDIATMCDNEREARDAAKKALTALYQSAAKNACVDVEFCALAKNGGL